MQHFEEVHVFRVFSFLSEAVGLKNNSALTRSWFTGYLRKKWILKDLSCDLRSFVSFSADGGRYTCIECCSVVNNFFSHFPMVLACGACKYRTSCKVSIGNHMIKWVKTPVYSVWLVFYFRADIVTFFNPLSDFIAPGKHFRKWIIAKTNLHWSKHIQYFIFFLVKIELDKATVCSLG